jgi:hypothetical protein
MKIFKMNDNDFVAAENLESAKQCLAEMLGNGIVTREFEGDFIDDPEELSEAQLDKYQFHDEGENPHSFRTELELRIENDEDFPQFFASSEY